MTQANDIWAVVPVKELGGAKSRLSGVCTPDIRYQLVMAMAEDVLNALANVPELAGTAVVTLDPSIAALARKCGAQVFEEGARDGHAGAVTAAAQHLAGNGHRGILALPGDIPLVTASEISCLIAAHRTAPALTIVQAHDGQGSNAVMLTPPDMVPFAFGENSFSRHIESARRFGIEPTILTLSGIRFDIDDAWDLALFLQRPSRTRSWACLAACGVLNHLPSDCIFNEMGSI